MPNIKKRQAVSKNDEPQTKKARLPKAKELDLPVPQRPKAEGNVLSCGMNEVGQLGLGEDVSQKTRPSVLSDLKNVVDIRAGGMHSLCLTSNGEVWSFGCNDEGALGRDTSEEGAEFTAGKVDLRGVCVKISAGDSHSACLLEDGTIYAWGSFRDSHGNMGLTLEGNKRIPVALLPDVKVVDIASGADHLVILSAQGKLYTVGCGEQGQLGRVTFRSASGDSRRGKSELLKPEIVPTRKSRFIDGIWATNFCTFYRDHATQKIFGFGLNNHNQLALPGKDRDKTLLFRPSLTEMKEVKTIDGGQNHTLVLTQDNQCYVVGRKEYGRLGLGEDSEDATALTRISNLGKYSIESIGCGDNQSFAVTSHGTVFAWGMGDCYQLGLGSDEDSALPTQLTGAQVNGKRVLRADGGGQHSLFLIQESSAKATEPKEKSVPVEKRNGTGGDDKSGNNSK
ncbi:regulator of chromosome condensation [Phlebotomus papatasi]|uniref:RCC1-like domain-containing protein n=1 Tax=Phlebotomus papatasi TaxID=29031 RepID=A0A1B0D9S9_PHLPP|nr:regulator of chromosome condensation [Phlebotomus papatasi]